MRYAEYPTSPPLARIAECYWILEGHGTGVPEPIIPDGRIEIILHYGSRREVKFRAGTDCPVSLARLVSRYPHCRYAWCKYTCWLSRSVLERGS